MGIELVAAGALTLAAAAGYQVTAGYGRTAWWLWALCWLQSAGSILYIYLRLEHRRMTAPPPWPERLRMAKEGLLFNAANLAIVALLAALELVPAPAIVPFGLMLLEFLYGGLLEPAVRVKPAKIGVRQILVSVVFSVSLILAYRI
jgi:hypothetical protein